MSSNDFQNGQNQGPVNDQVDNISDPPIPDSAPGRPTLSDHAKALMIASDKVSTAGTVFWYLGCTCFLVCFVGVGVSLLVSPGYYLRFVVMSFWSTVPILIGLVLQFLGALGRFLVLDK
ncbi:MAG: hypothetical protein ACOX6D_00960 [Thermoguttaceae bacterium]|jgi:hypothetical protein